MALVMPTIGQVTFIAPTKNVTKGDIVSVEIRVKTRDSISALQFTLEWTPSVLEFKSVDSVMLPSSSMDIFGLNSVAQGNLKFLWLSATDGINIPDSSIIFKLKFKAIGDKGTFSDIKFTNSLIKIKALNPKIESLVTTTRDGLVTVNMSSAIVIVSDNTEGGILLHQNIPNPVQNMTNFPFELKESGEVSLEIFDTVGRMVFQKKAFFNSGKHQIEMNTEGVLQKGTYIYGIRTNRRFISRTLLKI